MIYILLEDSYSDNTRYHQLLGGITSVAKKKHLEIGVYKSCGELPSECRVAILICQSLKWSTDRICELNDKGVHPLIFGFQYLDTMYRYSSIAPNYTKSAYRLTRYILSENPGKTAILGYNEDSLPDRLKYTGIKYAVEECRGEHSIFSNNGDVMACIRDFEKSAEGIENIVCCNDNIAVTIYNKFPHLLKGRKICSCSGLKISEYFEQPYPVCRINYYEAGVQLAMLYRFLTKESIIYSTVMTLDMDFLDNGTVEAVTAFPGSDDIYSREEIDFYGDNSLRDMELLDRMLTDADETDIRILKDIVDGKTYDDIAEALYMATNTVKYRIKKMADTAGVSSRRELAARLLEYGVKL